MGPIQLYLVRHAIAEERGPEWPDDRLRPLTADGRQRMERAVKGLVELGVSVDEILTSPLVRTRQTADILGQGLRGRPRVVEFPALEPGERSKAVFTALTEYADRTSLALVGHEPGIGELAAALIGLRAPLAFKKGAVGLIEVAMLPPSPGAGELRWFATPRVLRKIG